METEKITINIGAIDLGQIDLLVEQGFYSNRTDFIRTAIRNQNNLHSTEINRIKASNSFGIDIINNELKKIDVAQNAALKEIFSNDAKFAGTGVFSFNKKGLEEIKASGNKIEIKMVGMLIISKDVSPELIAETFQVVKVFGIIRASDAVKQVLLGLK
jgi:Arc/MetJ-type ribon-helix-helix transcriptional regulator